MPKGIPKNGINKGWFKKGSVSPNKGNKYSEISRKKISDFGKTRIGDKNGFFGHKHSDITKNEQSFIKLGKKRAIESRIKQGNSITGYKNHNWRGGISNEPYSVDWTETLKKSIRERDHYVCKICFQNGNTVHHIDYDKKNNNPLNLITLCRKCHLKTNYNREYWIECFLTIY